MTRRVIGASVWTFAGYGLGFVIRLGSNLLLTRLLVPEMFGVTTIATVVLVGLSMFSDVGLGQVIIRSRRGDDPVFANTVWTTQIVRGFLLWILAILVSAILTFGAGLGLVGQHSVYADPNLPPVIAILAATALIDGFASTKGAQSRRNIDLGRLTQIDIVTQLVGVFCMFAWVYFDRSIWALVAGALAGSFVRTILTHAWLQGHANRLQWNSAAFREIFGFGKWIFFSSILGFLVATSDRLLLGGLIGAAALGVYSIAFTMANAIDLVMTRLVAAVALPALSEIVRERPENLKRSYYRFFGAIAAVCYFASGVLIVFGQDLISLLYDNRYADAGWMLQILVVGAVAVPYQVAIQCFLALGMPQIHSRVLLVRLVALVCGIAAGFHWFGLPGALWGIVVSQVLPVFASLFWLARLKLLDLKREALLLAIIPLGMFAGQLLSSLSLSVHPLSAH